MRLLRPLLGRKFGPYLERTFRPILRKTFRLLLDPSLMTSLYVRKFRRQFIYRFHSVYVAVRMDNFVVGLTNDDSAAPVYKSSYTVCGQFSGPAPALENATVVCSPSYQKFRFVIIHGSQSYSLAICLNEVYVFARSK